MIGIFFYSWIMDSAFNLTNTLLYSLYIHMNIWTDLLFMFISKLLVTWAHMTVSSEYIMIST